MTTCRGMKVIYIAGPYRHDDEWMVWQHIMQARDYAAMVWRAGGVPVTPHLNSMMMHGLLPIEKFLEGDCELISRCDALLLTGDWQSSEGSLFEKAFAETNSIPVFTTMGSLRDYLEKEG